MNISASDVRLGPNVLVAYATYYKSPAARKRLQEQAYQIERALPHFRSMLNLPPNFTVRIGGLKSHNLRGRYYNSDRVVALSSRLIKAKEWMQTLAHELVHAEQYHTGKLKDELVGNKWMSSWEGSIVWGKGTTYAAYRALPWEVEAFDRQEGLAACVLRGLGLE